MHSSKITTLALATSLALVTHGLAQEEDIDPGDPPDFTPPAPTQTTVKAFPGTPESPAVIVSRDGRKMLLAMPTSARLDFQVQVSPDLENWSDVHRRDAAPGNGAIQTFMVDLAAQMALFARVVWF